MKFSVIDEPWIKVLRNEGNIERTTIRDILRNGGNIKCIIENNILIRFGIQRLLSVILQDSLQLDSIDSLIKALSELKSNSWRSRFTRIENYLNSYEDRFDLFSDTRPFLQDPTLPKNKLTYVATLNPSTPSGINVTHLHRGSEKDFIISAESAIKLLTIQQPFVTMGGGGMVQSINGTPPWYVTLVGNNLLETLLLNCYCGEREVSKDFGIPAWRRESSEVPSGSVNTVGYLEALTWQPRRILLIPIVDEKNTYKCSMTGLSSRFYVEKMVFKTGAKINFLWPDDPNVVHVIKEEGKKCLKPSINRHYCIDLPNFVFSGGINSMKEEICRPSVIEQFSDLVKRYKYFSEAKVSVYGFYTDKAKYIDWNNVQFSVPINILANKENCLHIRKFNTISMKALSRLRMAVSRAITYNGKPETDNTIANNACNQFLLTLNDMYLRLLPLADEIFQENKPEKIDALLISWTKNMYELVHNLFLIYTRHVLSEPKLMANYNRALKEITDLIT